MPVNRKNSKIKDLRFFLVFIAFFWGNLLVLAVGARKAAHTNNENK